MGIISRMTRLWRADLHGVMDQLEDKKLLLKQYLREMKTCLEQEKSRQEALVQAISNIGQARVGCEASVNALEKDLALAIRKEKDDIARMLIRKQRVQKAALAEIDRQHRMLVDENRKLCETLDNRQHRYDQLRISAAAYNANPCRNEFEHHFEEAGDTLGFSEVSDSEVEIELLQRKEDLSKEVAL